MILEIKIPSPGESITEVEIGKWLVENGAVVQRDQEIAEIESDKATLSLTASATGKLKILLKEGERVTVGSVACTLDTDEIIQPTEKSSILLNEIPVAIPVVEKTVAAKITASKTIESKTNFSEATDHQVKLTPAAKAVMEEAGLNIEDLLNGLRRISR